MLLISTFGICKQLNILIIININAKLMKKKIIKWKQNIIVTKYLISAKRKRIYMLTEIDIDIIFFCEKRTVINDH